MGSLVLPTSGIVYLDANCFIYSVERIDPYRAILDTLWQTVSGGQVKVVTIDSGFRRISDLAVAVLSEMAP